VSDGVTEVSWAAVCARRLQRHGLAAPLAGASPADVVAMMCGAHAQILSAAELSIGVRLAAGTRADVRNALWGERSLVKTFGPRGTVHLLPAAELPMWTGALSALSPAANGLAKDVRLTPEQIDAVVASIAAALHDAELTIDELGDAVVADTGGWAGDLVTPAFQEMWPRWRQGLSTAAHRGAVCFGPNRGPNVTYTSPRRWLPGFRPADGPGALADILRRYLHAYGPATSSNAWSSRAVPPGCAQATPLRRRPFPTESGCCRTSMRTWCAVSRVSCSTPATPPHARWPAGRPATTRSC